MHLGKFKKTDANKKILLHTRYPIAWIHISVTNCIKHFISLSFHTKILVLAKKLHIVGNTVCKCICIAWCIIRIKKKSFLHVSSNVSLTLLSHFDMFCQQNILLFCVLRHHHKSFVILKGVFHSVEFFWFFCHIDFKTNLIGWNPSKLELKPKY